MCVCLGQLTFIFTVSPEVSPNATYSKSHINHMSQAKTKTFFSPFGCKTMNISTCILSLFIYVLFNLEVMHLYFVPTFSAFSNPFVPLKVIVINMDLAKSLDGEIKCCSGSPPFPTLSAPSH